MTSKFGQAVIDGKQYVPIMMVIPEGVDPEDIKIISPGIDLNQFYARILFQVISGEKTISNDKQAEIERYLFPHRFSESWGGDE